MTKRILLLCLYKEYIGCGAVFAERAVLDFFRILIEFVLKFFVIMRLVW